MLSRKRFRVARIRPPAPAIPGIPAPKDPAPKDPAVRRGVRRVLARLLDVVWVGFAVSVIVVVPLLITASGGALLVWSGRTFFASHGTVVITTCRYDETPADSGPPTVSSSCTGRFVADDGHRIIERVTYSQERRIEAGDHVAAWVTARESDRAMSHRAFYLDVVMALGFCLLGGWILISFGLWVFDDMVIPRRRSRQRPPAVAPAGSTIPGVSLGAEVAHRLDRAEARRIALRAQLLDSPRPSDLVAVVRQLTLLQIDQTTAVAPSADLAAWSRLGSSYQPDQLRRALERDRTLFEYNAMVLPIDDLGLYLAEMEAWPWRETTREWLRVNDRFRRDVLDLLGSRGPLLSRDIPDTCVVPWRDNSRNVLKMLTILAMRGEVAISRRSGRQRVWDLAERVYPAGTVAVSRGEANRIRDERRLRSLGLVRAGWTQAGEPATVEGVEGAWQVDPVAIGQPFTGRTALLSPFDGLVRDQMRVAELFGFTHILEMDRPKGKRQRGLVLPVLHDDRFIGKVAAVADPGTGTFVVHSIHEDVAFTPAMTEAVHHELQDLASWLHLATGPQDDRPVPPHPGGGASSKIVTGPAE